MRGSLGGEGGSFVFLELFIATKIKKGGNKRRERMIKGVIIVFFFFKCVFLVVLQLNVFGSDIVMNGGSESYKNKQKVNLASLIREWF